MKVLDLNKKIKVGYQFHEFTTTHAHSFWEFCIVNKGPIIHKTNNNNEKIETNTVVLISPNNTHSTHQIDNMPLNYICVGIDNDFFYNQLKDLDLNFYNTLKSIPSLKFPIDEEYTEFLLKYTFKLMELTDDSPQYRNILNIIYMSLILELYKTHNSLLSPKRKYSQEIIKLINILDNPQNFGLNLKDLILKINFSYTHTLNLFKKEVGVYPHEYFTNKKLAHARKLLMSTNIKITEIAERTGFYSYPHFYSVYKKRYKVSPLEQRKIIIENVY